MIATRVDVLLHEGASGMPDNLVDSGYVFAALTGKLVAREVLTKHLRELNELTGLPPVRLHDLRHGVASLMLAAGADDVDGRLLPAHPGIILVIRDRTRSASRNSLVRVVGGCLGDVCPQGRKPVG